MSQSSAEQSTLNFRVLLRNEFLHTGSVQVCFEDRRHLFRNKLAIKKPRSRTSSLDVELAKNLVSFQYADNGLRASGSSVLSGLQIFEKTTGHFKSAAV